MPLTYILLLDIGKRTSLFACVDVEAVETRAAASRQLVTILRNYRLRARIDERRVAKTLPRILRRARTHYDWSVTSSIV